MDQVVNFGAAGRALGTAIAAATVTAQALGRAARETHLSLQKRRVRQSVGSAALEADLIYLERAARRVDDRKDVFAIIGAGRSRR